MTGVVWASGLPFGPLRSPAHGQAGGPHYTEVLDA